MRAIFHPVLLAESEDTIVVEGNHYFPAESLRRRHFTPSSTRTRCSWKGEAHYYDVSVDGVKGDDVAWYYPEPKPAAAVIEDRVAFSKDEDVEVAP